MGSIRNWILQKSNIFFTDSYNVWNQDIAGEFQRRALIETADYVSEYMTDIQSCNSREQVLLKACKASMNEGLILEFGVYKGFTINMMAKIFKGRRIFGFDSFEGLPENWRDRFPKGSFSLDKIPSVRKNVDLRKGWFNVTIPDFLKDNPGKVSLIHIDCDLYSSAKTVLDQLVDRFNSGTIIVFDEYFNYPGWKNGEFKAFRELILKHNLKYHYLTYNSKGEQVAIVID